VTRKVTRRCCRYSCRPQDTLYLGNLDARRDWGYAPEYVEAMWQILQQDTADDFVIGTGESHSVREFVEASFAYAGLDWQKHVKMSDRYLRPLEVDVLIADAGKARAKLGWESEDRIPRSWCHHGGCGRRSGRAHPGARRQGDSGKKIGHWNRGTITVTRMVQAVSGQASQH